MQILSKNMLYHSHLMNVVRSLNGLKDLAEFNVPFNSQKIKIVNRDGSMMQDDIEYLLNELFLSSKVITLT